jgi:hypothetical protein
VCRDAVWPQPTVPSHRNSCGRLECLFCVWSNRRSRPRKLSRNPTHVIRRTNSGDANGCALDWPAFFGAVIVNGLRNGKGVMQL